MTGQALLLGIAGASGVLLAWTGWSPQRRPAGFAVRSHLATLDLSAWLLPGAAALAVLVATRQPAAAVIGALAARAVLTWRDKPVDEAAQAEALALWTEGLRNAVGAADGVETVLADSARHAPPLIRDDVQRLVRRLPYEPLDDVLRDRSGSLAHPTADLVFRALGQAASEGGSLQQVLHRLAKRARGLAAMHRRIDVAREQPRSTLHTVTAVIIAFTALLFLGARDWMSVYATPLGQIVLLAVTAWGVWWYRYMARMARIEPIERFYAGRSRP